METGAFKTCPHCKHVWPELTDFLSDPEVRMGGYQVAFHDLLNGLFIFTHFHEGCHTTMAIPVKEFASLSQRPVLNKRTVQPDGCSGHCVRKDELAPCPVQCECTWVREILKTIADWPQKAA